MRKAASKLQHMYGNAPSSAVRRALAQREKTIAALRRQLEQKQQEAGVLEAVLAAAVERECMQQQQKRKLKMMQGKAMVSDALSIISPIFFFLGICHK